MAAFGQIQEFQPESESSAGFVERAQLFFTANDILDRKKTSVLLSSVRGSTYGLLHKLIISASSKDKSFKEIIEVIKAYFEPKPIVIVERYRFQFREQAPVESMTCSLHGRTESPCFHLHF